MLEVRKDGSANTYEQYVYDARYIDAPVMVYRDTKTDGANIQKLYVLQDANFNVTATVDGDTGAVVNRFDYTPYGQRTVLTATWTAGTTDFMLGHQGLYLDGESGLYYNRARYLHPTLGAFTARDPLGFVDGANLYQYVSSVPTQHQDPTGTQEWEYHGEVPTPYFGEARGDDTVLSAEEGCTEFEITRRGGSRAWRNHNPGNIRAGKFANAHGAIGRGPGGFAIFPDDKTGADAIKSLLRTDEYQKLTISEAIAKYAPPKENDTKNYQTIVAKEVGVAGNKLMSTLNDTQLDGMVRAIRRVEGWNEGQETIVAIFE